MAFAMPQVIATGDTATVNGILTLYDHVPHIERRIFVYMKPESAAKARPRFGGGHVYTPKRTVQSELAIKSAWMKAYPYIKPWEGAVRIDITFYFQRPKSHYRTGRNADLLRKGAPGRHIQRPDEDNLGKMVKDALNGLAYTDDRLIYESRVVKKWSESSSKWNSGIEIIVSQEALGDE